MLPVDLNSMRHVRRRGSLPRCSMCDKEADMYSVTPVPTYLEMLQWAAGVDAKVDAGLLPGLNVGGLPSGGGRPLSGQDRSRFVAAANVLKRRSRQTGPMTAGEMESLRGALEGIEKLIADRDTLPKPPFPLAGGVGGPAANPLACDDAIRTAAGLEGDAVICSPVYGSREVRDKIYLYVWSLLQKQQGRGGSAQ
ncbi:unnamed protein product [Phaeothamnion confervicola]